MLHLCLLYAWVQVSVCVCLYARVCACMHTYMWRVETTSNVIPCLFFVLFNVGSEAWTQVLRLCTASTWLTELSLLSAFAFRTVDSTLGIYPKDTLFYIHYIHTVLNTTWDSIGDWTHDCYKNGYCISFVKYEENFIFYGPKCSDVQIILFNEKKS